MTPLPPLPRSLADPRPVVGVGTLAAFLAAGVLAVMGVGGTWMWSCLVGGLLGLLGFAVMHLQRGAARRGSRGAQRNLE